ncbi:glycosyltransferase family 4 protein [Sphingomonas sp. CGMCC 1.13654]|uniref:Glycosyltransferase family 4 protein n=1 Tax=Sphingomonas chungangi TaxID=2683589 RepID=A0A838LA34_9SPHN|nr:glycosyltransferase family 4 protein [Sphingomonas chungangi]MBA2935575.1 glycosyltransferase family 4 protein [Sphingomonas chungangi]MVW54267.1 glycosyltransferase [Sphingomonas chungangi]
MRIAYIINSVEGGGAALPVPSITKVLREGGAEVRIYALTRRDGRAIAPMEASGLEVIVREGAETDHFAALGWLDSRITQDRPTHIWTSLTRATLLGQLVGLRRRLPVVSWQHAAYLKPANRRLLRLLQPLSRLWIGDSDAVTRLTAERLKVPAARLMQWPIFRADASAPTARPWRPGETVRIGSLGRLHPVKGFDVLIDALARLPTDTPRPTVVIAGEGSERAALDQRARSAGVAVDLAGYSDDPHTFLAGLHLYVQPSRSEGLCVAAHEAMQAGLPVVASAVGQLPYSIADRRSGLTVPPGDPDALAAALAALLREPSRLETMGRQARADVLDRFSPDRFREAGFAILDRMRWF